MSINEEFDELARRKMAERDFHFQEADWHAARALIDAERGSRKAWPWYLGAALLLISGSLWYWNGSTVKGSAQTAPVAAQAVITSQQEPTTASAEDASAKESASRSLTPASVPQREEAVGPTRIPTPKATADASASSMESPAQRKKAESQSVISTAAASNPSRHVSPRAVPQEDHAAITTGKPGTATADDQRMSEVPSSMKSKGDAGDRPATGKAIAVEPPKPAPIQNTVTSSTQQKQSANTSGNSSTVAQERARTPVQVAPPSSPETPTTAVSTQDSTSAGIVHPAPSDSAASTPTPAVPPLVPERAPWEIGILGGWSQTQSRYSGGGSEAWSGTIHGEGSPVFGAEIMHMGRNIGLGTGLHYGSYAERLRAPAVERTTTSLQDHWFLAAIDTTVLVITDTLPGNPASYTGTNVTTTIQVLMNSPDTVVTTQRVRDARDQVNRVSYLEIPLLLDAHLVQGRWSLGLRGGPTLGLLTSRRGAVPNATEDGYVNFTEQPFRELVLGYTARAYVHYRFNAAWSVGLGPVLRGLLSNSLGDGALERRNSALGAMMSLSYRLR